MSLGLPTKIFIYPQNDLVVDLEGLADVITEIVQNSGTVVATLYDQRSNPVVGFTSIPLTTLGSAGNYRGTVANTFNASPGGGYWLVVTATVASVVWKRGFPAEVMRVQP